MAKGTRGKVPNWTVCSLNHVYTTKNLASCTKLVFWADRKTKMEVLTSDWLTFSNSPLKQLNGIQTKLHREQELIVLYQVVFFGPIGKPGWPPWPLSGWDIFEISSTIAEWNSSKLGRILSKVCVFGPIGNQDSSPESYWPRHFRHLLWNCRTEFGETWQEASTQFLFTFFFLFFKPIEKQSSTS